MKSMSWQLDSRISRRTLLQVGALGAGLTLADGLRLRAAGKPVALVNGRVSKRSLARWRRIPGIAADLLAGFSPCLAQSPADADHLKDLGAYQAE